MARKIDVDAVINRIRMKLQGSQPTSPDSGYDWLYVISGSPHGGLYLKDPAGREIGPFITGSPSGITMDQADPYGTHHRLVGSSVDDDEFNSNTIANYTELDITGTTTWTISNGVANCIFTGQSSADYSCLLKPMTLSDNEWFETEVRVLGQSGNYSVVGIVVTDGVVATSNAISGQILRSGGNWLGECYKGTLTNMATVVSSVSLFTGEAGVLGMRIKFKRNSSTSFQVSFSTPDGAQFEPWTVVAGDPGFTPTHAGIFVSTYGGGSLKAMASFDFLRHMS